MSALKRKEPDDQGANGADAAAAEGREMETTIAVNKVPRMATKHQLEGDLAVPVELADRMKALEATYDQAIPPTSSYVIRLDGVAFHTYTQGMKKPFDERIRGAFVSTCKDLLRKFNPSLVYHQSDEISMLFRPAVPTVDIRSSSDSGSGSAPTASSTLSSSSSSSSLSSSSSSTSSSSASGSSSASTSASASKSASKKSSGASEKSGGKAAEFTHAYSGRVQKLASVTASFAAARFNHYIAQFDWSDMKPQVASKIKEGVAYFDARAFEVTSPKLAYEAVYWRQKVDCFRNAISAIAQSRYSPNRLHGASNADKMRMLRADFGIDIFRDFAPCHLYGTFFKMELFEIDGLNPKTGQTVKATRTRVCTGSFKLEGTDESLVDFALAKYWPDNGPPKDPPEQAAD